MAGDYHMIKKPMIPNNTFIYPGQPVTYSVQLPEQTPQMKLIYPKKFKVGKLFTIENKDVVEINGPNVVIIRNGFNITLHSKVEEQNILEEQMKKMQELLIKQQIEKEQLEKERVEKWSIWDSLCRPPGYNDVLTKKHLEDAKKRMEEIKKEEYKSMYKWKIWTKKDGK